MCKSGTSKKAVVAWIALFFSIPGVILASITLWNYVTEDRNELSAYVQPLHHDDSGTYKFNLRVENTGTEIFRIEKNQRYGVRICSSDLPRPTENGPLVKITSANNTINTYFEISSKQNNLVQIWPKSNQPFSLKPGKGDTIEITFKSVIRDITGVFLAYPSIGLTIDTPPEGFDDYCNKNS